ncbi:hypothetical protein MRB53_021224 [Persea americana]|uniref:Uncharacterized protein n=1 Tax=Persea americana TaxID=3435 RepID=A0ACC2L4B0_PERAE|nr:hypothetical protein MRB53_021224 [Persea americana]
MTRLENMDPRFYKAAMKGDMLLDPLAPNLTLCLTQRNTMLHIAIKFKKQEIVQRMIGLCSSLIFQPNPKGDTPLHLAARAGHLGLIKLLTPTLNLVEGYPDLEVGNSVQ